MSEGRDRSRITGWVDPRSVIVRLHLECVVHFKRDGDKSQDPEGEIRMVKKAHDHVGGHGDVGLKGQMIEGFKPLKGC